MPSNNSKYTQEIREQTARYVLESEKARPALRRRWGSE